MKVNIEQIAWGCWTSPIEEVAFTKEELIEVYNDLKNKGFKPINFTFDKPVKYIFLNLGSNEFTIGGHE